MLGAGKTSLVNHLLGADHGLRLAVFVNDFGALEIDAALIDRRAEDVLSLANGCICCSRQGDLAAQIGEFLDARGIEVDQLVIEASGIASPSGIVRALGYPALRDRIVLAAIVVVVDAAQLEILSEPLQRLAEEQIGWADIVVVNKTDLATAAQVVAIREDWRRSGVRFVEAVRGGVPWALLLDQVHGERRAAAAPPVDFASWTWTSAVPLRYRQLKAALEQLPDDVFRAKGFVRLAEAPDQACLVQVVGRRVEITRHHPWTGPPRSALAFIAAAGRIDWSEVARGLSGATSLPS